jgi:predicted acyltransferase
MELNKRLTSLDVFRGMTVAAMILVNNPGSWEHVYSPLLHAQWHGCTPTDLIFPFFVFSVGISIHLAYTRKKDQWLTKAIFLKILKRSVIIFLLGLLLSLFPYFNFETVRIPGVLQRISVAFFGSALLYFTTSWLAQLRITIVLLVGYYLVMTLVPVPGVGPANLEANTNLAAWLDNTILPGHLWSHTKTWDPEGILSTLPAIATCLIGVLTGQLFSSIKEVANRTGWLFFTGGILIVLGLWWNLIFPINKALWTSSYVLYTAGIGIQVLASLHWIIDGMGYEKWSRPFSWYGLNAIFVFVGSGLLAKTLIMIDIVQANGSTISAWSFIHERLFASWLSPVNASLGFALMWVSFFGLILYVLYRKKIFIKI